MDSDGYFWFVGRADDVIISSGFVHLPLLESNGLPGAWGLLLEEYSDQRLLFLCRYRIGPFEVESALIEHPAVVESAVVSSPDPIRGEVQWMSLTKATILHFHVLSIFYHGKDWGTHMAKMYTRQSTLQVIYVPKRIRIFLVPRNSTQIDF
jgi:acyl-coenzyme A synthetase/AMP-(fatty) acid ligase